jgi:uncharacterized membrane protein
VRRGTRHALAPDQETRSQIGGSHDGANWPIIEIAPGHRAMPSFLKTYLIAVAIFLPLDFAWIGLVAVDLYKAAIGPLMLETPRLGIATAFYLLYVVGIVHFAIRAPDGGTKALPVALRDGALFGAFCYMTYDLTNLATLKGYTVSLALADIAWGTLVTAATAGGTAFILRRTGRR